MRNRNDTTTLDDDFVEFYGYDQSWRLTTVWRQDSVGAHGSTGRHALVIYERFLHNPGWGSRLDAPLMSQVNDHWDQVDEFGDPPFWDGAMPTANSACKSRSGVLQTLLTGCRPYEEQREMSHNRAFVLGSGLAMIAGIATALAQGPIGTYYVSDSGSGFPRGIWAHENGGAVTRTAMTFDLTLGNTIVTETGPLAVYGNTVATNGHWGYTNRQAQNGEIFTRGPGGTLTTTGQITTNLTTTDTFWDGTSDGTYNYMIGSNSSAQGTIYRCNLDWSNPTPVAVMNMNMTFIGITYDASDNTFFISAISPIGLSSMFHVALPPSVGLVQSLGSFFMLETSAPNALAMDLDGSLWMTQIGGTMMHYSKAGAFLGSYTPSDPASVPFGGEIAPPIPTPGAIALGALGGVVALRRRRR